MVEVLTTKTCSKCRIDKPASCFVLDRRRPSRLRPQCRDCSKDYYAKNSSHILATNQRYREKNRVRVREWNKRYGIRRFFFTASCRLKIREKGQVATYKELAALWKFQRGTCVLTGRRLTRDNVQLDHIVPLVRGGSSTIENLRWVHRDVNYAKRDLFDAEFIALCQEITLANITKERT